MSNSQIENVAGRVLVGVMVIGLAVVAMGYATAFLLLVE